MSGVPLIELRGAGVRFGDVTALRTLDLTLHRGDRLALVVPFALALILFLLWLAFAAVRQDPPLRCLRSHRTGTGPRLLCHRKGFPKSAVTTLRRK